MSLTKCTVQRCHGQPSTLAIAAFRPSCASRATLIWHLHARGPMKQRELAAALRVSPRNVTALLDALEPSGLVADQQELARYLFADVGDAELAGFTSTMEHVLRRLGDPEINQLRQAALARWISRHGSAE